MEDTVFNVGDLIQSFDDGQVCDGVVLQFIPAKIPMSDKYWSLSENDRRDMHSTVEVKWDDDSVSMESSNNVEPRDSDLEREFRNTVGEAEKKIAKKLVLASKYLSEAVEISEEYGVPFSTSISFLGQSYTPASVPEGLDKEFVESITGTYNEYGYEGWEHSAVC